MKRNINYIMIFLFMALVGGSFTACVNDDDYSIPEYVVEEPDVTVNFTIANALEMMEAGGPVKIESNDPLYLEGYVVSNDEAGNFHKNLVIQDSPENPTAGINISTHATDMYTFFEPGRKVYVRVDGLYVGNYRGLPMIGDDGDEIDRMSVEEFDARVLRSNTKEDLVPTQIGIDEISDAHLNTLIQFNNVEFPASYNGLTYANIDDNFGVDRTVQDCDNNSVIMRNSGYADFRTELMPTGNGELVSVLSVFNGTYQLMIRDTDDVQLYGERCDGEEPGDGGDIPVVGLPFSEDFDSLEDFSPISIQGWTNHDVSGSTRLWEARSFDGNGYAQLTAYNASVAVETWLVTPGIDLNGSTEAKLSFQTKDGHYNGNPLSVYISTDFSGNATSATWTELTGITFSEGHDNGYGDNFISSGDVDLSSYAGQIVYIGFKYEGADSGVSTTMQLDNVSVSEDGSGDDNGGDDGDDDPTPPSSDAQLVFAGGDFENWQDFVDGLNQFGIQEYATQSMGTGVDGSASLNIATNPSTTSGNDYVFTAHASSDLPSDYEKITFYMKGSSDKSVSINVYKEGGGYYVFNLGSLTSDSVLSAAENNQYNGNIDTNGEWVLVSLDLSSINDINVSDSAEDIFALKIGKEANYDLHFDNFMIE